jgi:hypothetical protein
MNAFSVLEKSILSTRLLNAIFEYAPFSFISYNILSAVSLTLSTIYTYSLLLPFTSMISLNKLAIATAADATYVIAAAPSTFFT